MFVGLVIVSTILVSGYLILDQFKTQQQTFNTLLATNALNTNTQIVELRTSDQVLEQGINDLDAQQSLDIARLEDAIRDQQNVIDIQQGQIDSIQRQVTELRVENNKLWTRIYDLEGKFIAIECEVWGDGVSDKTENPCGGYYDRYGNWVSANDPYYPYPYYGP